MSAIQENGPHLKIQAFFFSAGAVGFAGGALGSTGSIWWKALMKDCVAFIFWNCWDPLHTLKLQVFFVPCEHDMTEQI